MDDGMGLAEKMLGAPSPGHSCVQTVGGDAIVQNRQREACRCLSVQVRSVVREAFRRCNEKVSALKPRAPDLHGG